MRKKIISAALYTALAAAFCWAVVWNGLKCVIPIAVMSVLIAIIVNRSSMWEEFR